MGLSCPRNLKIFIWVVVLEFICISRAELVELTFPQDGYLASSHLSVGNTITSQGQDCYAFTVTEYVDSRKKE